MGKREVRDGYLVLGMHRSGTSAVSGTLAKLGAAPPKTLLFGNPDNPRGHWESVALISFHDELLASAGSKWDDWRPFNPTWYETPVAAQFRERARELLCSEFEGAPSFVLKDPRICRFPQFWLDVFAEEDITPRPILPVRQPLEVAQSLKTRDGFLLNRGILLWLRHALEAERATRGIPRAVIEWSVFLKDWRPSLSRAAVQLGTPWPRLSDFTAGEVDAFLTGELMHERVSLEAARVHPDMHRWAIAVYEALLGLEEDPDSDSACSVLDEVKARFDEATLLFGRSLSGLESELDDLRRALASDRQVHEQRAQEIEAERQAHIAEVNALNGALQSLRLEHDAKAEKVRHLAQSIEVEKKNATDMQVALVESRQNIEADLVTVEEKFREISVHASLLQNRLDLNIEESKERNISAAEELARRSDVVSALLASTSWRLTRPLRFVSRLISQPRYVAGWAVRGTASIAQTLPMPSKVRRRLESIARRSPAPQDELSRISALSDLAVGSHSDMPKVGRGSAIVSYVDQVLRTSKKISDIDLHYVKKSNNPQIYDNIPLNIIAFYLPQFHPIKENNEWWEDGFTEWTNVSKAVPQFLGHHQPHLPGELGFYDLRLVDVMRKQVALAKHYGIGGFCFHFYWFGGKRLLELPVNNYLENRDGLDFPFCLCWANENWTRRWDGQDSEILISQVHSPEDDIAFIDDVIVAFKDPRYIRFEGRPLLIVYRVSLLPDAAATAQRWRDRCREVGVGEIYLVAARSFEVADPRPYGFDAAVEFPPHRIPAARLNEQVDIINPNFSGNIYSYDDLATGFVGESSDEYPLIKTVVPSWDNEARKPGAGHVFYGSSPGRYGKWLDAVLRDTSARISLNSSQPPFVFCNAWNEWAEGAHLEPDRRYGYAFLHATSASMSLIARPNPDVAALVARSQEKREARHRTAVVVHLFHEELYPEFLEYWQKIEADIFISLPVNASYELVSRIVSDTPNAYLSLEPNRGRDILPFIKIMEVVDRRGYAYVCKIHSKKSPQRMDGESLRRVALAALLNDQFVVSQIEGRFDDDDSLGIIAPPNSVVDLSKPDRNVLNRVWLDTLLPRIGADDLVDNYKTVFVAGSMFWARVAALRPVLDLKLTMEEFESEAGQVDGTLAHAIERLWSVAAQKVGFATGVV